MTETDEDRKRRYLVPVDVGVSTDTLRELRDAIDKHLAKETAA